MNTEIVVIGAGPAGIEAAKSAAGAGATVIVISDSPVGGRAGWHSLLPSKVWLTGADTLGLARQSGVVGLSGVAWNAHPEMVVARIRDVQQSWNSHQADLLQDLGVEIVTGIGSFTSANEIAVTNTKRGPVARIRADRYLIATGSVPLFPETLTPDGRAVLAPRALGTLGRLPSSVAVIGAGATGSECAYLFERLGAKVTWIVDELGVLPAFLPSAGQFLADALVGRGVVIIPDRLADHIDRDDRGVTVVLDDGSEHRADIAFIATGRVPDLSRLDLGATGLPAGAEALSVDEFGRTCVTSIYAVGDATGAPMLANRAMSQARVAGRHAAGVSVAPFRADSVVQAIYSEPQVAQVGEIEGDGITVVRVDYSEGLKSHLMAQGKGFVALAFDRNHRITGGVAVGSQAADVLAPVAVAIHLGASLEDIAPVFSAHPTLTELAFIAARTAVR